MKTVFFILLFIYSAIKISAQADDERFRFILTAGATGTQVDGDSYGGYNKLGFVAGIHANRKMAEKTEFSIGLTYVQKGSRSNANNQNPNYYILRLHYVEVPWMFIYNYKNKYRFEGGLSGAYLFNSYEANSQIGAYKGSLKKYDFCYNFGVGYNLSEKAFFNLRYSYSLLPIRDYNKNVYLGNFWQRTFGRGLYNNCIQVSFNYIISPKANTND
jgi:hypothetical protein